MTAENDFDRLPISAVLRINAQCDAFEAECKAGQRPTIDSYLGNANGLEREALTRQLKQIEFDYHGLSVTDFLSRLQSEQLPTPTEVTAASATALAEELVAIGALTTYQSLTLLSSHPHPLALGEYLILDHIASGGMGSVYLALHRRMKRQVALKVVTGSAEHGVSRLEWFQREVETAARLHHPNLVTAYDAGEARGTAYLVSEYVPGTDLQRYVAERGPLSAVEAVSAIRDAALGLEYAHHAGVIHRDVKPSNLVRTPSGLVRVLDVGLARLTHQDEEAQAIVGTPGYMAPEQADDPARVDVRSDIYGLGATLYFVLTGRAMFEGSPDERLAKQRTENPPEIRQVRPDVSAELEQLLLRMTAREPSDRPNSITELLAELDHLTAPRRRLLVPLGLLACVAITGGVVLASLDRPTPSPQPEQPQLSVQPELRAVPFDGAAYQSQWSKALETPVQIEQIPGLSARLIPPGKFVMGTPGELIRQHYPSEPEPEREARVAGETPRDVTIESPFYLSTTEVTVAQFREFVESSKPAYLSQAERPGGNGYFLDSDRVWRMGHGASWRYAGRQPLSDQHPVCNLSRDDCSDYCSWLTRRLSGRYDCRLPTEAEWEYACRAGSAGLWSSGSDVNELAPLAWYARTVEADDARFRPVAHKAGNAFGLFDMHGNLEEWCTAVSPGGGAVLRGGNVRSWAFAVRSAAREPAAPATPRGGFRVVLVPIKK